MIYSIENNEVGNLKFMQEMLKGAIRRLTDAIRDLDACEDYDQHVALLESVIELLEREDSLCEYFIIQKSKAEPAPEVKEWFIQ